MRTYKIRLLKCSGKDQKISAYLQLLTGLDKVMANRIVSNLPATLFDNLDEEGMEYFKEAFDFYEVEYEITPLEETCEVCWLPSDRSCTWENCRILWSEKWLLTACEKI